MRVLLTAVLALSIVFFPVASWADEPVTVIEFEDLPAEYVKDGKKYVGILVSETEYEKILLEIKDRDIQLDFWTSKYTSLEELNNKNLEINREHIKQLESIIEKNNSWFERNKGGLGVALGMVLAASITVGITYAVNQPGQ